MLSIYLVIALVVFIYDTEGQMGLIAYCWLAIAVFIAMMFIKALYVFLISLLELLLSVLLFVFVRHISMDAFIAWMFFNSFFCGVIITLRLILDHFRNELLNKNETLEVLVKQRTEQLESNLEEKELLIRELYHRTKNNMQLIASLLNIQFSNNADSRTENCVLKTSSRINAMSLVHDKLYTSQDLRFISLKDYINDLQEYILQSNPKISSGFNIRVDIQDRKIPLELSIPIGLVVNELISNTLKHAGISGQIVHLLLFSHGTDDKNLEFIIQDDGPGLRENASMEGLQKTGLKIVHALVVDQLKGEISYLTDNGFTAKISIPLDNFDKKSHLYTHSGY